MLVDPSRIQRNTRTYRCSSWDRSGCNHDYLLLDPGQTVSLLDVQGPGRITHIYWTTIDASRSHFRELILRAWWDGEQSPSVEVPLGDLFCVPHCNPVPVQSLAAVVNPGESSLMSWGLNLYLPMPFASAARIELEYDRVPGVSDKALAFWYHIHLERYTEDLPKDLGRFHAQWRRENPTTPKEGVEANECSWNGANLDGLDNYVVLEAKGVGQMVGVHLQVDNLGGGWYGEGDDMIFVDGDPAQQWPPAYPGTGTEEIFGGGAGPNRPYAGPYTGFHMAENEDYLGKNAMFRWYLVDPIRFERSLVWTIEHGHDNNYVNDYTSVAYWYQVEPHTPFPALPQIEARLPRFSDLVLRADAARKECRDRLQQLIKVGADQEVVDRFKSTLQAGTIALKEGRLEEAIDLYESQG